MAWGGVFPLGPRWRLHVISGDKRSHGGSSGLYRTSCDVRLMLGPFLLGWIADTSIFAWALYFNAALLMIGVVLFAVLARGTGLSASGEGSKGALICFVIVAGFL